MNSGELKVDVPLAAAESDGESDENHHHSLPYNLPPSNSSATPPVTRRSKKNEAKKVDPKLVLEGGDSVTGSLEDLVNSFDDKLTQCFKDYQEQVEKIAPVQVRSQEEIMNECQVWWTITGNFGNMMPIDWSKSTARAKQLSTLNLGNQKPKPKVGEDLEEEDDMVAADLDMHSLILTSNPQEHSDPVKSADEVIKEIDEIIDAAEEDGEEAAATTEEEDAPVINEPSTSYLPNLPLSSRRVLSQALRGRNLEELSINELTQILTDIELLVRELSEELVSDLGVRDELEYEKELKNTFISLLLSIQSRRRACNAETSQHQPKTKPNQQQSIQQYKYLTTVIPYQPEKGTPSLQGLQVLVKILKAINEDSPAVPALLTDYILKVLCPS